MKTVDFRALPERVQEKIYVEPNTGCWLWLGYVGVLGYGNICKGKAPIYVHRMIWEFFFGPTKLHLHHRCETRSCCNPAHLQSVTRGQHVRLSPSHPSQIGRNRTHCSNGHERTPENVYYHRSNGGYECRICNRERMRIWKTKHG